MSSHFQFNRRPSTLFHSTVRKSFSLQKTFPKFTDSTSEEKVSGFNDFDYIKSLDPKQSVSNDTILDNNSNGFRAQLQKDHLSKALKRENFKLEATSLEDILHKELTDEYLKCIYFTSIYVIDNYFGKPGPKSEDPQKILSFVNHLIQLQSKVKKDCLDRAKKVKAPDYVLNIKILEASNLTPTDPNGLSDPFCKIWIADDKRSTQKTTVKERTLNPKWFEIFTFRLDDVQNDGFLNIEIWDKDPEGIAANIRQMKDAKGLKGLCLSCNECCRNICSCRTDDFVGKVNIQVKDIYCEGIDSWLTLKDRKGNNTDGKLHVLADFKVLRPKHVTDALKRHLLLLKVCLNKGLKEFKESIIVRWEQFLSPSAITLMFQHAIQSSLSSYEDLVCRYIVFVDSDKSQFYVNYQFLHAITYEAYECNQQLIDTNYRLEDSLENLYRDAVNNVYEVCKSVIATLHSIDFIEDENQRIELEFLLRCINTCNDVIGKKDSLASILKSEAIVWFEKMGIEMNNIDPDIKAEFITKSLKIILSYYSALDKVIRNIFPDTSYTKLTCEILDSVLSEKLKLQIIKLVQQSQNTIGETKQRKMRECHDIFTNLKELINYLSKTAEFSETTLRLGHFREWFGPVIIEDWFKWKQEILEIQINRIISNDNLENKFVQCAGRLEKQSSSVVLTTNLIEKELTNLWHLVSHDKYPMFNLKFLEILHLSCMSYADCLLDLIYSRNLLSNFHSFGKRNICAMANNLWALLIFAKKTVSDTVISLPPESPDTRCSLKLACYILCSDLCKEFEQEIVAHIKQVADAGNKKEQLQAINVYANRIQSLFCDEAMTHMAFEVYLIFTREVWKCVIKAIEFFKEAYVDTDTGFTFNIWKWFFKAPSISTGLLSVLVETEKLLFIDDQGQLKKILWNDDYKALKNELQTGLKK